MSTGLRRAGTFLAAIAVATLTAAGGVGQAAPPKADATAPGMDLTARWWTAALASGDLSFFADSAEGGNCITVDLPRGPVVLVAGTLGGASAERSCVIPTGSTVVIPAVNAFWANTEPTPVETIGLARRETRSFVDAAVASATLDGQPVRLRRIRSSRFLLDGTAFGVPRLLPATSDGYWLVFRPEPGVHTVTTSGASGDFATSTSYTFVVG